MRRLLRLLLRVLLAGLALLAISALGLALALRPPRLRVPEPGELVLRDVTVVNPGMERLPHRDVRVRGGVIESIAASRGASGEDARFTDATVLPGLIDLHVHHPASFAPGERELFALLFLAHGVTSVRDVGATLGSVLPHAQRIADGKLAGPRVFACGPFLDGDPPEWPTARAIPDAAEARRAVAELAASGVRCVKIYNGISPPAYEAIREEAEARNLPVVVHVPYQIPVERLGKVEVQHLMGLSWSWEGVNPREIDAYAHASLEQGIWHTPTLVVFPRTAALADYAKLRLDPVARLVPPYYSGILWNPDLNPLILDLSPGQDTSVIPRIGAMRDAVSRLYAAGVPILAGTDTMNPFVVPGASLHEELGYLSEAGLGLEGAWVAATRRAGEALRVPDLGVLREGAPADLLVFRADPTRDLDALATLEAVVADGRLYTRDALRAELARQGDWFAGPLRTSVAELLVGGALRWYQGRL